jgi:hypothetical protein
VKLRESDAGELESHFCVFQNAQDFSESIEQDTKQQLAKESFGR